MKQFFKAILIALVLPIMAFAQMNFIPISVDYASFRHTDSTAYVEVYISVFQGNLNYVKQADGSYKASFTNTLKITDLNGKQIDRYAHAYSNTAKDTSGLNQFNQLVDIFSFYLPYGKYKAKVQMVDQTTKQKGEYVFDLNTIRTKPGIYLSDLEFCQNIQKSQDKTDRFYKNGLRVVPNPRGVFDILEPMLYFYVELNNLPFEQGKEKHFNFSYCVTTTKGDTVKKVAPAVKRIVAPSLVEVGGFNVMALPQNNYILNIKVENPETGEVVTVKKPFYVYKPKKRKPGQENAEQNNAMASGTPKIDPSIALLSKKELKKEFEMARYIASRQEEKIFKNIHDANGMREFLTQFWYRRDKVAGVPLGTNRREFLRRVQEADQKFRAMGKEGWQTDRGRILLKYGEPDEVERYPSSMDLVPYEVWYYNNLEGGSKFIFADLRGFGEYELIHSTYRKELQNPNWRQLLEKHSGMMQNENNNQF